MGQRQRLGLVMGDIEHRQAGQLVMQPRQFLHHAAADLGVQGRERLIQQQDAGPDGERAGDGDALLLAAGELAGIAAEESAHPHHAQAFLHALLHQSVGRAPGPEAEGDILLDPHMGKEGVVLHHHAEVAGIGRQVGHVALADADPPGGGLDESRHGAERRRLARAGGADDGKDLAGMDGEA